MDIGSVHELWLQYERQEIDSYIAPDDGMKSDVEKYLAVGKSAARTIVSVLVASSIKSVNSVLDFGCGHGRVARHVRALFPDARLAVADMNKPWVDFCAERYQAIPIVTQRDIRQVTIPGTFDLVWVGSVFTHIDYARMRVLFRTLIHALNSGGLLVASFRGPATMDVSRFGTGVSRENWDKIVSAFDRDGVGYEDYGLLDWPEWGQSLISAGKVAELGYGLSVPLIFFSEMGWSQRQDIAAWQTA